MSNRLHVSAAGAGARPPAFGRGDPAPWFSLPASTGSLFHLSSLGGRYVVLCFFGSLADPRAAREVKAILRHRGLFGDHRILFFGVSTDATDRTQRRAVQDLPGIRYFWDEEGTASRLYRAILAEDDRRAGPYRAHTVVLDPSLRVLADVDFDDPRGHAARLVTFLRALPPPDRHAGVETWAPVLIVPRVFESAFCRHLIGLYEAAGGEDSGFMREVDGKTVSVIDHAHKRRHDYGIVDEAVRSAANQRIHRRLVPEIKKAFQFDVTRIERYIVACYDAGEGGYFRPHRDNTTKGTAHRRFAVSINLNAEEFEGGDLRFPEFGPRTYRPPTGGAVVFSCSLLHEATPVTKGTRYVFLPFLYDEAGARLREQNNRFLGEGVVPYRSGNGAANPTEKPTG